MTSKERTEVKSRYDLEHLIQVSRIAAGLRVAAMNVGYKPSHRNGRHEDGENGGPTTSRVDASKIQAVGWTWNWSRAEKSQQSHRLIGDCRCADATNKLRNITVCSKLALKR